MFHKLSIEWPCRLLISSFELIIFFVFIVPGLEARMVIGPSVKDDPELVEAISEDLRNLSGLRGLEFDEYSSLHSASEFDEGSPLFREFLLDVIADNRLVFVIENNPGSKLIRFAKTDAGTVDVETGIVEYVIELDAEDFRSCRKLSSREALEAFSIGLVLFHEIDHKVSYDPNDPMPPSGVRPDVSEGELRGVIERTNLIRNELKMALRDPGRHQGEIYRGSLPAFRSTASISFTDQKGKRRLIRWKLDQ
ncbi:MAG: hypothetical protein DWQ47_07250 [Acidobacteria bacterium]|nr:MAG: hypothetical protein DWQ32_15350 [Acidobacteriota bacterium]REJ99278.1 MAG: hypothetical protein DWQ38_14625 [Acidobacteriota bacterium]REK16001.1 MAG: hypothetical protein DWQ43_03060 [Acidobacteriota bacterium]REK43682.1 MAG: hypothetical protein DWQ47_07250 [Acidobacteriota bacterium]